MDEYISLENIRNGVITSDEWVELTNILAQDQDMADKDWERMPEMKEWLDQVKLILRENHGAQI